MQANRTFHVGGGEWISVVVDENKVYPCVVKMFKKQHVSQAQTWNQDLSALTLSRELSDKFNKVFVSQMDSAHKISFARAVLFKVSAPGSTSHFGGQSMKGGFFAGLCTHVILAAAFPEAVVQGLHSCWCLIHADSTSH